MSPNDAGAITCYAMTKGRTRPVLPSTLDIRFVRSSRACVATWRQGWTTRWRSLTIGVIRMMRTRRRRDAEQDDAAEHPEPGATLVDNLLFRERRHAPLGVGGTLRDRLGHRHARRSRCRGLGTFRRVELPRDRRARLQSRAAVATELVVAAVMWPHCGHFISCWLLPAWVPCKTTADSVGPLPPSRRLVSFWPARAYSFRRGSSASRRPLPTRLNASAAR